MSKNYLLVFFGFFIFLSGYSQTKDQTHVKKDSLEHLYGSTKKALNNYEYGTALQKSLDLLHLATKYKNEYYLYHGYNFLGVIYANMEDTARAKDNYLKSLDHAIASKNDTILWWAYNNVGNIYSQHKNTIEKGIQYYNKAIAVASRINDTLHGIDPIMNIAWTYLDFGHYNKALPYLLQAQDLIRPTTESSVQTNLQALFGMYYTGKGNYEKAICFFENSVHIAEQDSLIPDAAFAYQEYAAMLYKSESYQEAYQALEKHLKYQDKIFEEEKLHQMEATSVGFEMAEYRKDIRIAEQEKKYKGNMLVKTRQITILLACSFSVLLLFFFMLYKNNRSRRSLIYQLWKKNKELNDAKNEAEHLSLLKTRFFSTVSHELRTPLYGVIGLTSLLLEDNTNKEQEEDLKSLKFSADYLLALINDVLQMSKMESKLVHLENMPFNILDLMKGIVKSFEFVQNQNKNQISLNIDERIPTVLIGDAVRLSQVLMNLVGNALKFTERGKVWIKAERKECEEGICRIYFEVGDTGKGIPIDKQKEVFEEFTQLKSGNYNYQGTGLGLSIVKKLLHLFKAKLTLKSGEGKGSVFSFEIDFEEGKGTEIIGTLDYDDVAKSGEMTNKKVLIVDDNRINQIITRRILEKNDFECEVAENGKKAIQLLKTTYFDLILMDVNMPGMNGMQTTMEIRKLGIEVPVIALTAVEVDEMRETILASGMNDIIVKPYDVPKFFRTIFRNLLVRVEEKN